MKRIRFSWRAWLAGGYTLAVLLVPVTIAVAGELEIGDPAPGFALQGSDGKVHELSDYRGRTVVLAWFPKAFTGG